MKRVFSILLFCGVIFSAPSVQAQSLDDLMKSLSSFFSSEQPTEQAPKEVYPAAEELIGVFKFDALAIDYKGDSTLASLAVSTLEGQLPMIAEKLGVVVGRDYLEIADDGSMLVVRDGHKAPAYCSSYDAKTGRAPIMMRVDDQNIYIAATIIKVEGRYKFLFDATDLFALMAKHYSKFEENTTLQMIKGVVDNYPGIRVGAIVRR